MRGHSEVMACWSAKGGAGTTVVAAALAQRIARRTPSGVVLVDAAGDAPAVLGLPEPDGPGLAGWLRSGSSEPPADVAACPGLLLIPRGDGPLAADRADQLADALGSAGRPVVVDCGSAPAGVAAVLAERADQSIFVTRPCYVALRRFVTVPMPTATGVIVIREPGRVLSGDDVAAAVGAPIVAEIDIDPAVARTVDAGLLAARVPASLDRGVAAVLDAIGAPGQAPGPVRPGLTAVTEPDQPEASAW